MSVRWLVFGVTVAAAAVLVAFVWRTYRSEWWFVVRGDIPDEPGDVVICVTNTQAGETWLQCTRRKP